MTKYVTIKVKVCKMKNFLSSFLLSLCSKLYLLSWLFFFINKPPCEIIITSKFERKYCVLVRPHHSLGSWFERIYRAFKLFWLSYLRQVIGSQATNWRGPGRWAFMYVCCTMLWKQPWRSLRQVQPSMGCPMGRRRCMLLARSPTATVLPCFWLTGQRLTACRSVDTHHCTTASPRSLWTVPSSSSSKVRRVGCMPIQTIV